MKTSECSALERLVRRGTDLHCPETTLEGDRPLRLAACEMGSWRYDGGSEGGGAGKLDIGGGISSRARRRPPRRPSNPTGHQQTGFCERGAEFAGRARVWAEDGRRALQGEGGEAVARLAVRGRALFGGVRIASLRLPFLAWPGWPTARPRTGSEFRAVGRAFPGRMNVT